MQRLAVIASAVLLAASARAQFFEARTTAMGGAGVAAARYVAAPLANPALLARAGEGDSFGMILPAIGARVADDDGLIDDLDEFQTAVEDLQDSVSAGTATPAQRQDVANRLLALDGKAATAAASLNFVFAFPGEDLSFALVARSYVDAVGFPQIDPNDANLILTSNNPADFDNLGSEAVVFGVGVADLGVSIATDFEIGPTTLMLGVTPKYQRVDTYNYALDVKNFDSDDFRDSQYRGDDSNFNIDAGAALDLPAGFSIGVMARDLIEEDYDSVTTNGRQFRYTIEPAVTVGAAWTVGVLTLAADVDVIERTRFGAGSESQFVGAGLELDFDLLELRGGARFDLEDTFEDLYSAGVGLDLFDTVQLDVTGMYGDNDNYGAVAQLGFTF